MAYLKALHTVATDRPLDEAIKFSSKLVLSKTSMSKVKNLTSPNDFYCYIANALCCCSCECGNEPSSSTQCGEFLD